MKHIERIRDRILRGQQGELTRLRVFISQTDGNQEAVDKLHGDSGTMILARVTEIILEELGHATSISAEDPNCMTRRAARKGR